MGKGVFAYAPLPSGPLGGFAKGYPGLVKRERQGGREEGRSGRCARTEPLEVRLGAGSGRPTRLAHLVPGGGQYMDDTSLLGWSWHGMAWQSLLPNGTVALDLVRLGSPGAATTQEMSTGTGQGCQPALGDQGRCLALSERIVMEGRGEKARGFSSQEIQ